MPATRHPAEPNYRLRPFIQAPCIPHPVFRSHLHLLRLKSNCHFVPHVAFANVNCRNLGRILSVNNSVFRRLDGKGKKPGGVIRIRFECRPTDNPCQLRTSNKPICLIAICVVAKRHSVFVQRHFSIPTGWATSLAVLLGAGRFLRFERCKALVCFVGGLPIRMAL
jgi:hypothetical protein